MTLSVTDSLSSDSLTALYNSLGGTNGGFLYLFGNPTAGGAVPVSAAAAISTVSGCILLATIGVVTGSTCAVGHFTAPTIGNTTLYKSSSETWTSVAANNGTGYATFFRFCTGSDNGQGNDPLGSGSTARRVQGTVGAGPGFDMILPSTSISTANPVPIATFFINLPQSS